MGEEKSIVKYQNPNGKEIMVEVLNNGIPAYWNNIKGGVKTFFNAAMIPIFGPTAVRRMGPVENGGDTDIYNYLNSGDDGDPVDREATMFFGFLAGALSSYGGLSHLASTTDNSWWLLPLVAGHVVSKGYEIWRNSRRALIQRSNSRADSGLESRTLQ